MDGLASTNLLPYNPRGDPAWLLVGCSLLAGCLLLLATGCRCEERPEEKGGTSANRDVKPEGECKPEPVMKPQYFSATVGGAKRSFYVLPPKTASPKRIVVAFHGRGRSGRWASDAWANTLSQPRGDELWLLPDGQTQAWMNSLVGWDHREEASADLQLFDAMLQWARTRYCIESPAVHAVGYSWGASMANLVACTRKEVRTLSAVAGGAPLVPCTNTPEVLIIHGRHDTEEPIESSEMAVERWAFTGGCNALPDSRAATSPDTPSPEQVECRALTSCQQGAAVSFCTYSGRHEWPFSLNSEIRAWLSR